MIFLIDNIYKIESILPQKVIKKKKILPRTLPRNSQWRCSSCFSSINFNTRLIYTQFYTCMLFQTSGSKVIIDYLKTIAEDGRCCREQLRGSVILPLARCSSSRAPPSPFITLFVASLSPVCNNSSVSLFSFLPSKSRCPVTPSVWALPLPPSTQLFRLVKRILAIFQLRRWPFYPFLALCFFLNRFLLRLRRLLQKKRSALCMSKHLLFIILLVFSASRVLRSTSQKRILRDDALS